MSFKSGDGTPVQVLKPGSYKKPDHEFDGRRESSGHVSFGQANMQNLKNIQQK
jgi:hypothetical protein